MTALAEVEGATYRIGAATLVDAVTLAVPAGALTVVVGPNGAGKSTLVRLLAGEIRPSAGRVTFGGRDLAAIPAWQLACGRAVLPQASQIAFPFTVAEVTRLGVDGVGRGLSRADRAGIVAHALVRADVAHLADRLYQSLSGGERQRAQLARVLAQLSAGRSVAEAQLLILDEPVASLDLKHQLSVLETAASLAREGVGVLAVLHDLNLAAGFADEIVAMRAGRIAARGPPASVLDDRLLTEVFEVDLRVGELPAAGGPFVLPRRRSEPLGTVA